MIFQSRWIDVAKFNAINFKERTWFKDDIFFRTFFYFFYQINFYRRQRAVEEKKRFLVWIVSFDFDATIFIELLLWGQHAGFIRVFFSLLARFWFYPICFWSLSFYVIDENFKLNWVKNDSMTDCSSIKIGC